MQVKPFPSGAKGDRRHQPVSINHPSMGGRCLYNMTGNPVLEKEKIKNKKYWISTGSYWSSPPKWVVATYRLPANQTTLVPLRWPCFHAFL